MNRSAGELMRDFDDQVARIKEEGGKPFGVALGQFSMYTLQESCGDHTKPTSRPASMGGLPLVIEPWSEGVVVFRSKEEMEEFLKRHRRIKEAMRGDYITVVCANCNEPLSGRFDDARSSGTGYPVIYVRLPCKKCGHSEYLAETIRPLFRGEEEVVPWVEKDLESYEHLEERDSLGNAHAIRVAKKALKALKEKGLEYDEGDLEGLRMGSIEIPD